jgi:hypothetical protein
VVQAILVHTLQADNVYQLATQLHIIISAVSHEPYVDVAANAVGLFAHKQLE